MVLYLYSLLIIYKNLAMYKIKIINLVLILCCAVGVWGSPANAGDKVLLTVLLSVIAFFWIVAGERKTHI